MLVRGASLKWVHGAAGFQVKSVPHEPTLRRVTRAPGMC